MAGINSSRRRFIKVIGLSSASLLSVGKILALELGDDQLEQLEAQMDAAFDSNPHFQLIDNSLLHLHFYFVNVRKTRHHLQPATAGSPSYMIIRLPQLHVSERGFWDDDWNQDTRNKPGASLSGYSYLAFRLWPPIARPGKTVRPQMIPFTLENLLNWNDSASFDLITLVEWFSLKGIADQQLQFRDYVHNLGDFIKNKVWSSADLAAGTPQTSTEPADPIYRKYKSIVTKLLDGNVLPGDAAQSQSAGFIPVTFLEVPQGAATSPYTRNAQQNQKTFWPNRPVNQRKPKPGTRKYEVWNNQFFYQSKNPKGTPPAGQTWSVITPSFRIMGIISDFAPTAPTAFTCDSETETSNNTLPSLLDKAELTFLTQLAKNETAGQTLDFTDPAFDIQELNGLFITGLGVIAHFKYNNVAKKPPGIDLIEYEHIITEGRDILIRVSRLGFNSKTGHPYKHVIEGRRKITTVLDAVKGGSLQFAPQQASFIELKQYCECLEKDISYLDRPVDGPAGSAWSDTLFEPIPALTTDNPLIRPVFSNPAINCHYRRQPHKKMTIVEKQRVPIKVLRDTVMEGNVCDIETNATWFWPILEKPQYQNGDLDTTVPLADYFNCEYTAGDWDDKPVDARTPFIFIRASLLELNTAAIIADRTAAYNNYFKGTFQAGIPTDPAQQVLIDRRKTFLNNQKLAYVSSTLPDGTVSNNTVIETLFTDSYFRHRATNGAAANTVKYVVFPQLLRWNGYSDHLSDLTYTRTTQVLEYHENYVSYGASEPSGNHGLIAYANTDTFMANAEEAANNTYTAIKNALQEAKDKLGNLVVPDISPDTISQGKFGLTLPKGINDTINGGQATLNALGQLASLSPLAILRGKLSEILGGIDLTGILNELLPQDDNPFFQISNAINTISSEITDSPVYQAIQTEIKNVQTQIQGLIDAYSQADTKLKNTQATLQNAVYQISQAIPNSDQLDNLVKQQFEQLRTQAWQFALTELHAQDVSDKINQLTATAKDFINQEITIMSDAFATKYQELMAFETSAQQYVAALQAELVALPPAISAPLIDKINEIAGNSLIANVIGDNAIGYTMINGPQANIDAFLQPIYGALLSVTPDKIPITVAFGGQNVTLYYETSTWALSATAGANTEPVTSLTDLTKTGYLQLQQKLNDLTILIQNNNRTSGISVPAVTALQQLYATYSPKFTALTTASAGNSTTLDGYSAALTSWINEFQPLLNTTTAAGLSAKGQNIAQQLNILIKKISPYVDFLRRIDPYFYYTQQQQLSKDIADIQRRFLQPFYDLFVQFQSQIGALYQQYVPVITAYRAAVVAFKSNQNSTTLGTLNAAREAYITFNNSIPPSLKQTVTKITTQYIQSNPTLSALYNSVYGQNGLASQITGLQADYTQKYNTYLATVQAQAGEIEGNITDAITNFINEHQDDIELINEARNLLQLLQAIKQQDVTYTWQTTAFKDVTLGILAFHNYSDPPTTLTVDVKATVYFTPGKLPPTIQKVTSYSSNTLTNFGITFFSILTVAFNEVSFIAGTDVGTQYNVKIKSVQFDGALSFVQAFEQYLQTIDKALIIQLKADHVGLTYSLPLPSIETPAFSFFNLSLNFGLELYFDKRPLQFTFSLATAESKFGISATIYAGFGFFTLIADTKNGIVGIDCALEAGAWAGISIGPISGEVKLAFGFRYTKDQSNVRLEGYIVAEGRLSVWILEVSARIYLGVVSENSYVEGECTVSYSVKVGLISKSFSGSFHKSIAGASSQNQQSVSENIRQYRTHYQQTVAALQLPHAHAFNQLSDADFDKKLAAMHQQQVTLTYPVSEWEWNEFMDSYK
jgi:hypothetical protein